MEYYYVGIYNINTNTSTYSSINQVCANGLTLSITNNTISVQNTDASAPLYIGNESVTVTEYGIKLFAGQIWSADLKPDDQVYAVGTSTVAVMILEK
jgi:hypothetical protein